MQLARLSRWAALPLLAVTPLVHALSIDFGEGPAAPSICSDTGNGLGVVGLCSDGSYLSQSYGDVAGVADVTYTSLLSGNSLHWWASNYNTLFGVAWADGNDTSSQARIELKPLTAGAGVTLTGFDMGAYPNTSRNSTINIFAIGGGAPLYSFSGPIGGAGNTPTHFAVNISSATGLWIEWKDSAYNNGIDHIQYSVGAVPEPASVAILLAGLAAIGGSTLRRRR